MKYQEFTVKADLPSLNEYVNSNRYNRFAGAALKKEATDTVALFCRLLEPIDYSAEYEFTWYRKHRRKDPDNIAGGGCKAILDGLQKSGKLPNDNWKYVLKISHNFVYEAAEDSVLVQIIPIEKI